MYGEGVNPGDVIRYVMVFFLHSNKNYSCPNYKQI